MAITNTLKATPNKTTYNAGETITVTLSGEYSSTSDAVITGVTFKVDVPELGQKLDVTSSGWTQKDAVKTTYTTKTTAVEPKPNEKIYNWTISADGKTATAVA